MEENLKVDKDYLEAFNLGYEMAKELNLKFSMFKDAISTNNRMNAIYSGMSQYQSEIVQAQEKLNVSSIESDGNNKSQFLNGSDTVFKPSL